MDTGTHNARFAHTLLAHLAAFGIRDMCLSPGSRSTPLVLAATHIPELRTHVLHDERVAGFYALGIAKTTRLPVVLVSTSGTAAIEFAPAVVEAHQSSTPLVVLTADRPPELRGVGAPQTIDQTRLYGTHSKWSYDAAPPADHHDTAVATGLAERLVLEASTPPPGPVHLNIPFREPLIPPPDFVPDAEVIARTLVAAARHPAPAELAAIADRLIGARTLFVVGATTVDPSPIGQLAVDIGAVVFADIASPLRSGRAVGTMVGAADLLAGAGALDVDPPELVVRWGGLPTSKPVWSWLDAHPEVPQIVIDDAGRLGAGGGDRSLVNADPSATAATLIGEGMLCDKGYVERWLERDEAAAHTLAACLDAEPFPNEPAVAAIVAANLRRGARMFAGSSMPIRDVDMVAVDPASTPPVFGNRGANGIDGSIATALGAATAGPVVALVGDVAALYDLGGLVATARRDLDLVIVVVHNDGGGIFSFLPQGDAAVVEPTVFERFYGTPHGIDFVQIAAALDLAGEEIATQEELIAAVAAPGPRLVQVRTDRSENVEVHARIRRAVANALRS